MKLIALISWYDEDPDALEATIYDAARCGVTHLFALDGAYAAYPGGKPESAREQAARIERACTDYGIAHVVDAPDRLWDGEVEKRDTLFKWAAEDFAVTPRDWFLVLDADERIEHAQDLRPLLRRCDSSTGKQDVWDVLVLEQDERTYGVVRNRWNRRAFRCLPGLHVHPRSHWHYLDGDGRILWGYNAIDAAGHLPIVLRNHSTDRDEDRAFGRESYYAARNTQRLENYEPEHCARCDEPWTARVNEVDLEYVPTRTLDLTMKRTLFCCTAHFEEVRGENEARVQRKLADVPRHLKEQMLRNLREARVPTIPRELLPESQRKARDAFGNAGTHAERLAASAEIRRLRHEEQLRANERTVAR